MTRTKPKLNQALIQLQKTQLQNKKSSSQTIKKNTGNITTTPQPNKKQRINEDLNGRLKTTEKFKASIDHQHIKENENRKNQKIQKPTPMVNKHDRILLVGEGNFSFTVSLVFDHLHPAHLITTSTNDDEKTVHQKYPESIELIEKLRQSQVEILFELDCCELNKDQRIKKNYHLKRFDRVIFNFPHVGLNEPDLNRNIKLNQILLLRFLRSVKDVLYQSDPPNRDHSESINKIIKDDKKKKKNKQNKRNYDSIISDHQDSEDEHSESQQTDEDPRGCGTVLITLGTCPPYSDWKLPLLAKRGETISHQILYQSHPNLLINQKQHSSSSTTTTTTNFIKQPNYKIIKSYKFLSSFYPSYFHCKTNGKKSSNHQHHDDDISSIFLPSNPRTWEFQLVL